MTKKRFAKNSTPSCSVPHTGIHRVFYRNRPAFFNRNIKIEALHHSLMLMRLQGLFSSSTFQILNLMNYDWEAKKLPEGLSSQLIPLSTNLGI